MKRLVALVCLASFGCVTARPAGSDTEPLAVEKTGRGWDARLGDESVSKAALFRAAGFDDIADKEDDRVSTGLAGAASGVGAAALTALLFAYGSNCSDDVAVESPPGACAAAVLRWLTATYIIVGLIVAVVDLTAAPPSASDAEAAAASHNARLALAKVGVKSAPVKPGELPDERRGDDEWRLHFETGATPLDRIHVGMAGYGISGRFARLGLTGDEVDGELSGLVAKAKLDVKDATEFARFAQSRNDRVLEKAAIAALAPAAAGNSDALVALGDLQSARADYDAALASYRASVDAAPTSIAAIYAYGRALVQADRRHDAVELYVAAIAKIDRDADRFQLLDMISSADRTWLHAHADRLPAGLLPAYQDHLDEVRQQQRLDRCLEHCESIQWYGLQQECQSQCYVAGG